MKKVICFIMAMQLSIVFAVPVMAEPDVDRELEAISNAQVGDIVIFGTYEQDNNLDNGQEPVEWEVLEIQDGKALLISRFTLDCQPYNKEFTDVTWATCMLRAWLNQDFLDTAFSLAEAAAIAETTVINNDNPSYDTEGGNDTTDKIFLLSLDEIEQYYEIGENEWYQANDSLVCRLTDYGREQLTSNYAEYFDYSKEKAEEIYQNATADYGQNSCWWWLRSPGNNGSRAARVNDGGIVNDDGERVDISFGAVRPALWVKSD